MGIHGQSAVSGFNAMSGFSSEEQASFNSWLQSPPTVVLEPKKIKCHKSVMVSFFSPSIYHEVMGSDAMILVFLNVEF